MKRLSDSIINAVIWIALIVGVFNITAYVGSKLFDSLGMVFIIGVVAFVVYQLTGIKRKTE